jgi:putative FmdB family regulatory protein
MPVFDYRCLDCHKTYDVFHKGHEVAEDVFCPSCGSKHSKKLMSVPVISMNSGFSETNSVCETGGCCGGACGLN